jgi:hypothetical protein
VLNKLFCWIEDPNSEEFKLHIPRIYDYLWIAEDGMKMQSYNGSQLWDTVFTVQVIYATGLVEKYAPTLHKAHEYIKYSQIFITCATVFMTFLLSKIQRSICSNIKFVNKRYLRIVQGILVTGTVTYLKEHGRSL